MVTGRTVMGGGKQAAKKLTKRSPVASKGSALHRRRDRGSIRRQRNERGSEG